MNTSAFTSVRKVVHEKFGLVVAIEDGVVEGGASVPQSVNVNIRDDSSELYVVQETVSSFSDRSCVTSTNH